MLPVSSRRDTEVEATIKTLKRLSAFNNQTFDPLVRALVTFIEDFPCHNSIGYAASLLSSIPRLRPRFAEPYRRPAIYACSIEVIENIFDFATFPALVALGGSCKRLREVVRVYVARSLNNLLRRWFLDAAGFRTTMEKTKTVISGSTALSFISRDTHWVSKDLDLYVPKGENCQSLLDYLKTEGYTELVPPAQPINDSYPGQNNISSVHKLVRSKRPLDDASASEPDQVPDSSIDVIEANGEGPIEPILYFHTTLAMNYITGSHIISLYPKLTFARKSVEHYEISEAKALVWKEKYTSRGYEIAGAAKDLGEPCGAACPALMRSSRDVACLDVNLSPGGFKDRTKEAMWSVGVVHPELTSRLKKFLDTFCVNELCHRSANYYTRQLDKR